MIRDGTDMDAAFLYFGGLGIFVLVDHVLVDRVRHQLLYLILNPGRAVGREVHARIPVEQKFVPDKGVGRPRFGSAFPATDTLAGCFATPWLRKCPKGWIGRLDQRGE